VHAFLRAYHRGTTWVPKQAHAIDTWTPEYGNRGEMTVGKRERVDGRRKYMAIIMFRTF